MTEWSAEHRSFTIETYFKNNDSIVATMRAFRKKFKIPPKKPLPSRKAILRWVTNFLKTASALKISPAGPKKWLRTPEYVEKAKAALIKNPSRAARKHSSSLNISDRTLRRMSHDNSNFHAYKILITQELRGTDYDVRKLFASVMLEKLKCRPNSA
ncbi:hypothetical protein PGB90_004714 [Kerria lacca]